MTATYDLPFDFDHLIDVRPVPETTSTGELTLTFVSIERYRHGFVLVFWVESPGERIDLLAISARDDQSNSYSGRLEAGHGGGGSDTGWMTRVVYSFTPALDPSARLLELELRHVRRLSYTAPRQVSIDPADILSGPHSLRIDLNPPVAKKHDALSNAQSHQSGPHSAQYTPSRLVSVIPVTQIQSVGEFAIIILSLERYTDGFSLVMRTDYPVPFVTVNHRFDWHVDDGMGGQYRSGGVGGSGGGIPGKTTSWRLDNPFTPALPDEVTMLMLRIDRVQLREQGSEPRIITGPWEFEIGV